MPIEAVVLTVRDDSLSADPRDDVTVQVYDEMGATFVTQAVTGDLGSGAVQLMLEGDSPPVRYQVRFHLRGGSIRNPQLIEVFSPPEDSPTGTNNFLVRSHMRELPEAADPLLCRATGIIRGPDGRVLRGLDVHFIPIFKAFISGDDAVLGERVATRSDKDGFIAVELFRNAMYYATVESLEDVQREIIVPNAPAVDFGHLLFPTVGAIEFDPPGPWGLDIGEELEVAATVRTTSLVVLPAFGGDDVNFTTSDPEVFTVGARGEKLVLTGVGAGSAELRARRKDNTVVRLPAVDIYGVPVVVDVA